MRVSIEIENDPFVCAAAVQLNSVWESNILDAKVKNKLDIGGLDGFVQGLTFVLSHVQEADWKGIGSEFDESRVLIRFLRMIADKLESGL